MKNLIGIQFDSNEICLSQFDGKGLRMYSERMPENLVKNDQIVSQETFSSFLKDIKRRGHFTGRACALVLPLSTAYFRIISMPAMSDQQLRLNLPYEFKDYVGSDSFRYNFDYAVRNIEFDENGDPVTMELMAAAAQKETLDNYAAVLKKSGLRLKEAIPTEMALLNIARRAVKDGAKLDKEECICNIGMNSTILGIIKNGELSAFKVIDIGCEQIDSIIAEIYGIDPFLAASYRASNYENVLDNDRCRSVYDRLGLEITKTINFFRYENPDSELDKLTWTGSSKWIENKIDQSLDYIGFKQRSIEDWMPGKPEDDELAARCVLAIGAVSADE